MTIPHIKPHQWAMLAIGAIIAAATITLEIRSMTGAIEAHEGFEGVSWAMISFMFSIVSIVAWGAGGAFKDDYRPHIRRRAFACRVLAIAAMLTPASFFGSAIKASNMEDRAEAYYSAGPNNTPSLYQLDLEMRNDREGDVLEKREARERMERHAQTSIALSVTDGEFWTAIFFLAMLLVAADVLRIPAPITREEFDFIKRSEAAKKAAKTRKARARAKKQPKKLKVLQGGKAIA